MNIFYDAVIIGLIMGIIGLTYLFHKCSRSYKQPQQVGSADYLEITEAKTKEK